MKQGESVVRNLRIIADQVADRLRTKQLSEVGTAETKKPLGVRRRGVSLRGVADQTVVRGSRSETRIGQKEDAPNGIGLNPIPR
jgi:hypothetical protein